MHHTSWETVGNPPNINRSIEMKGGLLGRVRRSTLICCLKTRTSASSATRDRSRSITIPKISLHKSNIKQQHRPISINRQLDGVCDRDTGRLETTGQEFATVADAAVRQHSEEPTDA